MNFKDKITVITGASSGIGEACAYEFASRKANLVLAARNINKLKETAEVLEAKYGIKTLCLMCDVTNETDCKSLIAQTIDKFGQIDIMINNAGISMRALFDDVETEVLKKVMDVNFWGTVYCSKYALPWLLKNKGSLVAVSSLAGFHGLPGRTGYSASKFAVHGLMESIRNEHHKNGLHVMVLSAGFTASNIRRTALTADGSQQGESPRNEEKMATPEHVARQLARAIKNKKRNKILTIEGKLMVLLKPIIPNIIDKVAFNKFVKEPDSPLMHLR